MRSVAGGSGVVVSDGAGPSAHMMPPPLCFADDAGAGPSNYCAVFCFADEAE